MKYLYASFLLLIISCSSSYADTKFNYFYEMGGVALEEGEINSAVNYYNKAFGRAKTKKEKVKSLGGIISSNEEKGNLKAARVALRTLLKIDPKNKWALKKKKKIRKSKKKSSTKFSYYYKNAGMFSENDDYENAIDYYNQAFDLAKTKKQKIKALGGLITSYDNNGNIRKSRTALRALLKLDPKNKWALGKI